MCLKYWLHHALEVVESSSKKVNKEGCNPSSINDAARLRQLNLFLVNGRLIRVDLLIYWKIFHGQCIKVDVSNTFSVTFLWMLEDIHKGS